MKTNLIEISNSVIVKLWFRPDYKVDDHNLYVEYCRIRNSKNPSPEEKGANLDRKKYVGYRFNSFEKMELIIPVGFDFGIQSGCHPSLLAPELFEIQKIIETEKAPIPTKWEDIYPDFGTLF